MKIQDIINIMNKYGEAWENQNPDKIIDLFAED
jgi:hypothetical protein